MIEKYMSVLLFLKDGATPLHHASFRGFSHICSLLLSRGADVDSHLEHTHRCVFIHPFFKETPLSFVIYRQYVYFV